MAGSTPALVAMSTLIWVQGPQSSASVPTMPAAAMAAAGASRRWPSEVTMPNLMKAQGLRFKRSRI